jgi:ABC-type antimicrobial peptide transport system permease subunit
MTLVLRTAQEPVSVAAALRSIVRTRDANLPVLAIRTLREIVSASLAARRFEATLTLLFAVVALALGAIGVYGVVSYTVARRTRDLGVRIALGASRRDVTRWVLRLGLLPVVSGLVVGLAAAIALATGLRAALFGIAPTDPVSLGAVVVTLLSASALACWLPARRAANVDPIIALRAE